MSVFGGNFVLNIIWEYFLTALEMPTWCHQLWKWQQKWDDFLWCYDTKMESHYIEMFQGLVDTLFFFTFFFKERERKKMSPKPTKSYGRKSQNFLEEKIKWLLFYSRLSIAPYQWNCWKKEETANMLLSFQPTCSIKNMTELFRQGKSSLGAFRQRDNYVWILLTHVKSHCSLKTAAEIWKGSQGLSHTLCSTDWVPFPTASKSLSAP